MIDLHPLVRPSFWLNTHPGALTGEAQRVLFIAFALMLVLGAVIRMVATRRTEDRHVTETFNRIGHLCVSLGLLGLLFYFFAFEQIPVFSARYWFLLWLTGFLFWVGTIVRYLVKVVPQERAEELARREKEKYLPKPHDR